MKKIVFLISMVALFLIGCEKEFYVDQNPGAKVSAFNLEDFDGKKVSSKKLMDNGKKTLFVVAAEWCPHCKVELPEVQKFYDKYKDKVNVVVVFTNSNTDLGKTKDYVKTNEYTFPVFYDKDGSILRGFAVQGFPYNVVISNNKIEKVLEVPVDFDSLVQDLGK